MFSSLESAHRKGAVILGSHASLRHSVVLSRRKGEEKEGGGRRTEEEEKKKKKRYTGTLPRMNHSVEATL